MTDAVADTPHGQIGIRIDGPPEAPALLLINALGTTLELWDAEVEVLAARFRVIRYDVRGHGRSSACAPAVSLAELGGDARAVLDAAGAPTAHVAGISLGGLTALWLGVHEPGRVGRLVLANTAARVGSADRWNERIELVRTAGLAAVAERAVGTWFTGSFVAGSPAAAERCRRMVTDCTPDGYCGCCVALRDADLRGVLKGVRAPTLVIAGSQDVSTSVHDAEVLAGGVPDASLTVFDCAHLSNVERAGEFTAAVEAFLAAG